MTIQSSYFRVLCLGLSIFGSTPLLAASPSWNTSEIVPPNGRSNILDLSAESLLQYKKQGQLHAQIYPITVTGILPPYQATKNFFDSNYDNPLRQIISGVVTEIAQMQSFDQVLEQLGLHHYPMQSDRGVYQVPYPNDERPDYRLGFGILNRNGTQGFTFSCAACHSSELFGKTVLGMTNRFPKANEFFVNAKKAFPLVDLNLFQSVTGATEGELKLMSEVKENLQRVGVKQPIQLGLDTSLAQVSLSLNHRSNDEYATPNAWLQLFPRHDAILDDEPADSKPAVWWNVKYKNRWLSDGSVLSGNPIFTNIIWNEIGRGADLKILEKWLADNKKIVDELTAAVFATEAPKFTDFFSAEKINLVQAQRGEQLFNQTCSRCHGQYEKGWSQPNAEQMTLVEKLATTRVIPKQKTPVVDVGTDSYRRKGMKSLEQLNNLSISKKNNIVIKEQDGYVPPPLVGIWARWPYFHNNSVPDLCSVLTASNKRPVIYYAGEAKNQETDFDSTCNGYPSVNRVPASWKTSEFKYDTRRKGMSNVGHDEGIFLEDGKEIFTADEKMAIVQYLQTL